MRLRNGKVYNNFTEKCEAKLPPELLRIITEYHHCKKCYDEDNKGVKYCNICEINKKFISIRVCRYCEIDSSMEDIFNYQHSTHCERCTRPLIKLVYCAEFESIDLKYENYSFERTTCDICNIETYIMLTYAPVFT